MTFKLSDIITDVIRREGKPTNDPVDRGGRTQYGISEAAHPAAWADGKVDEAEARAIYLRKYVRGPGFGQLPSGTLQAQLVDFGVTSGPHLAITFLQRILGVHVDGVLGPETLAALVARDLRAVNNLLVGERIKLIGRLVAKKPTQVKYLNGWLTRALEFLQP